MCLQGASSTPVPGDAPMGSRRHCALGELAAATPQLVRYGRDLHDAAVSRVAVRPARSDRTDTEAKTRERPGNDGRNGVILESRVRKMKPVSGLRARSSGPPVLRILSVSCNPRIERKESSVCARETRLNRGLGGSIDTRRRDSVQSRLFGLAVKRRVRVEVAFGPEDGYTGMRHDRVVAPAGAWVET